uniref:rhodanese-like domain-containing protein n=1 Tax=Amycolatopsis balhimycina TaxID=208443 RepID=UPI0003A86C6F
MTSSSPRTAGPSRPAPPAPPCPGTAPAGCRAGQRYPAAQLREAQPAVGLEELHDLDAGRTDGYVVVETRAPEVFAQARIPGAINLPYREMTPESTAHLDKNLVYVCYCESPQCNAATKGALKLAELGFKVKRLSGGITSWIAAGYPTEGDTEGDKAPGIRCAC